MRSPRQIEEAATLTRWPSLRSALLCALAAAVAVAIDAYFSAQEGYLAKPPDYDGISYMITARVPYLLIHSLHLKTALYDLATSISPLWVSALTFQQLILGDGTWQAFSARFWAVALLLVLVYWIVSRRATRALGIAAVGVTALLPVVSAGVRASSWEFLTGQASYGDHWYLDDLRPDFLAIVLVMWSVAALAEHDEAPRRSAYLVSAAFAAAAVLAKSSTAPVALAAWGGTLAIMWFSNRRSPDAARMTLVAAISLVVLLAPWAVFASGLRTVVTYLQAITQFRGAYASPGGLVGGLTYFLVRIPAQLGPIEAWAVIVGAILSALALLRRQLGRAEAIYALVVVVFYVAFSLPPAKNPILGGWIALSIWIFFLAGVARTAIARWQEPLRRATPVALSAVAVYTLVVYAIGAFAIANWPATEQKANAQLLAVTAGVAHELGAHISTTDCFAYVPGPGWPSSLIYPLMDAKGSAPTSTAIDVDPAQTSVTDYVAAASRCKAVMAYREDISDVARVFFAPPIRQPYLRGVAEWVRSPESGYSLDRTWTFSNLPQSGPHVLGHYQGVSLTVDLYIRTSGN